jgi:hypothetical protein
MEENKRTDPSIVDTALRNIAYKPMLTPGIRKREELASAAASSLIVEKVCDKIYA